MTSPIGAGDQPGGPAVGVGTEVGGGRYVLIKAIGRGGMGDIYKAFDRQLDRVVAIKTVRADIDDDADARKRLAREARIAASLDHPFVCKIHELIPHGDGDLLLVMEYINGRSLNNVLDNGPIGAGQSVQLAREMAEALSVAHQRGLIHRDIKPSNIMLTSDGHVKIVDFGIAKGPHQSDAITTAAVTKPGRIIGTLAYMSPEHAAGRPVDLRTDIYSFGAVLYECLSGKLPFVESDDAAAAAAQLPQTAPAELRALVMKCLEFKRDARYENFDAVRAALDAPSLTGLSGSTDLTKLSSVPWRQRPRNWFLLIAATLAIAALGWAWTLWTAARNAPVPVRLQHAIVTWPSSEEGVHVSADGQKVAFVSTEHNQSRLLVQAVDGTDPSPIGAVSERLKTPVWSPDGQSLAFLFSQHGVTGIQIISVWGERKPGQMMALKQTWDEVVLVRWIGTRIYFSVSLASTKSVLWRWDTRTGGVDQITHAQGKSFTSTSQFANIDILPDESRIVFVGAAPDKRTLWTADLDGRNAVDLGIGPVVISPRWRGPSGKRVVYISNSNGQSDIWEFNLDTRAASALTTSPLEERSVDVSAAGDVLVADTAEENAHLWTMHPDRQEPPRQLTFDSRTDLWPGFTTESDRFIFHRSKNAFVNFTPTGTDVVTARWRDGRVTDESTLTAGYAGVLSPDGRRVAFVRRQQDSAFPELWVHEVGSMREPVRVSENLWFPGTDIANWDTPGQTVAWAAGDPSTLFFVRRTKMKFELLKATLDDTLSSNLRVLVTEENTGRTMVDALQYMDLSAAPDGTALIYTVLLRMPYNGGTLESLGLARPDPQSRLLYEAPKGTEVSIAGWRRGGTIVALKSPDPGSAGGTEVLEIHRDGKQRAVTTIRGLQGFTARLDPTRDRLYATVVIEGVATVAEVSLGDGKVRKLVPNDVDGITFGGFAVSPEGWLVYMRKETNLNVWLFDCRKGTKRN